MKINFQCIELTIQDDELGCTVIFSDSRSADDQFKSEEELINGVDKHLFIQRSYAEDEYDLENYYIASSESDSEFNSSEKIFLKLNNSRLVFNWNAEEIIIGLKLNNQELANLIQVFESTFKERIAIIE
ncbi:hypothetical protein [Putridiphycobacter roseus]|uniref:hypothetical protein n=1 Tax=Putridiphycobacter roseus TaxID=2219161 RepID=UPI00362FB3EA